MQFVEIETQRKELCLTQKELCERAGIAETTYCRLKSGQGGQVQTLQKLVTALSQYERAA